jgi:tripartite-type tricarboxylate transporter receptor subunit TctC
VIEANRSKAAPGLPTIGETVRGFAVPDTWIGFLGPAGMPATVTERLNGALTQVAGSATARSRLEAAGFEPYVVQAPEFAKLAPANAAAYRHITSEAAIKPE